MVHVDVNLALEDALEVALHRAAPGEDLHAEVHGAPHLDRVDVGAGELYRAVIDARRVDHVQVLEGGRVLGAELDLHVVLADSLALERRREGDGDIDLFDLDLDGARVDAGW